MAPFADIGAGQPEALEDVGEILSHRRPVTCVLDLNDLEVSFDGVAYPLMD